MNIQQFQYILAVSENRHFELAAKKCFITQSTLSTMISRFEDELGITIFDRKKKPVEITTEGQIIIDQLGRILKEINQLQEIAQEMKGEMEGQLSISVIPTIAPFLLPLFLQDFAQKFPGLKIEVKEQTTAEIMRQLKSRDLDIGIVSIPLKDKDLLEFELYDEAFVYYDAANRHPSEVAIDKLDVSNLCLLEEGHCFRTQVLKLCDLHKKRLKNTLNFDYKAGSIDSLLRFVNANKASTLLPFLSTIELPKELHANISQFAGPVPFRSVGIVVHRHFVKKKLMNALIESIMDKVSHQLPEEVFEGEQLLPL